MLPILAFPFLNVVTHHAYRGVSQNEDRPMHRRKSSDGNEESAAREPETQRGFNGDTAGTTEDHGRNELDGNEHSSLLSSTSGDDVEVSKRIEPERNHESPHLDVRGLALLPHPEFWQLFCMMGLMTGIGLMTIK